MGFLGRIIKPLVKNAFDRMQDEAMQERLKAQDEKVAKTLALFPIQELFNFGPMANITATYTRGVGIARTELENQLGSLFAPLMRDLNAFTGGMRNIFDNYYYENRLGGAIGGAIGQAAGFIVGFYLPGGPLLWSQIFGFLGIGVGTFVQEFVESDAYDHPDIPGSPGETLPPPDPYGDLPDHARDYINNLPVNAPAPVRTKRSVYANKIGRYIL